MKKKNNHYIRKESFIFNKKKFFFFIKIRNEIKVSYYYKKILIEEKIFSRKDISFIKYLIKNKKITEENYNKSKIIDLYKKLKKDFNYIDLNLDYELICCRDILVYGKNKISIKLEINLKEISKISYNLCPYVDVIKKLFRKIDEKIDSVVFEETFSKSKTEIKKNNINFRAVFIKKENEIPYNKTNFIIEAIQNVIKESDKKIEKIKKEEILKQKI